MNIHFVMTTVNTPHVLRKYVKLAGAKDVTFHVVMDWKSPHEAIREFVKTLPTSGNLILYGPGEIKAWPISRVLSFNHDALRVAAFIEAYKLGADVVITADDDNEPEENFFEHYKMLFDGTPDASAEKDGAVNVHAGRGVPASGWARSLPPPIWPRGFPYVQRLGSTSVAPAAGPIVFHQGLTCGDPDVDALTRANGIAALDRTSMHSWAKPADGPLFGRQPVNTQNSALRRKYVPFWWAPSYTGRHWDIVAGLLVQSVLELNERASSGMPFTYSSRNEHDNRADIHNEEIGTHLVEKMVPLIFDVRPFAGEPLLSRYRRVAARLQSGSEGDRYLWHLGEGMLAWADALVEAGLP